MATVPAAGSDGVSVYRPSSAVGTPPLVVSMDHTGPQGWETQSLIMEAADKWGFCVAMPDFRDYFWPNPMFGTNLMNFYAGGTYDAFNNPGRTSRGIPGWASAAGANPQKTVLTGWSLGGTLTHHYILAQNDPSTFKIIAALPVSGKVYQNQISGLTRTQKLWYWSEMGTADGFPWIGDGNYYSHDQVAQWMAQLNGWDGATLPAQSRITPVGNGVGPGGPYVVEKIYPTGSGNPGAKSWLSTAGATVEPPSPPATEAGGVTGGGQHVQPNGTAAVQNGVTPPNCQRYNLNDLMGDWIMNVVLVGGTGLPSNTVSPSVSGTFQVGQTLTCNPGTWSPNPSSYSYQWKRANSSSGAGAVQIPNANGPTYVLQPTDASKYVGCDVTGNP